MDEISKYELNNAIRLFLDGDKTNRELSLFVLFPIIGFLGVIEFTEKAWEKILNSRISENIDKTNFFRWIEFGDYKIEIDFDFIRELENEHQQFCPADIITIKQQEEIKKTYNCFYNEYGERDQEAFNVLRREVLKDFFGLILLQKPIEQ